MWRPRWQQLFGGEVSAVRWTSKRPRVIVRTPEGRRSAFEIGKKNAKRLEKMLNSSQSPVEVEGPRLKRLLGSGTKAVGVVVWRRANRAPIFRGFLQNRDKRYFFVRCSAADAFVLVHQAEKQPEIKRGRVLSGFGTRVAAA